MMYVKIINGQQKFSDCRTIQMPDGSWVCNPSEEEIAEAGWVEYIPPIYDPQPVTEPDTYEIIEAVKKMLSSSVENLSDEDALSVAALYPTWISKIGELVTMGERLWYDGKLYKVVQPHTVQDDWTPDVSTSLFSEVSIEEFPLWVQPVGSSDAYMTGDKVSYNGIHYVSTIDYNVYAPDVYGWEEI